MKLIVKHFLTAMLLFAALSSFGQRGTVTGKVTGTDGEPLIGAAVQVQGSSLGTVTDVDGSYSLSLDAGTYTLEVSYIGYANTQRSATVVSGAVLNMDVALEPGATELMEVVVAVGSRSSQRTITDSPVPIDIVSSKELMATGQPSFDRSLQYKVPSFNTVQTPVNDATSLLDPYEIRNMGPSRTLVLINGKRKNLSSLIYIQTSPGRGEGGADLAAIPQDAIKRVEILRDGASAQYGSDAIAGVINVILKDKHEYGTATLNTGITSEGDGEMVGISVNNGANFLKTGFINYTMALSHKELTNRPGKVDAEGEAGDFGADIDYVKNFLALNPYAGNINGDPERTTSQFLVNAGLPVNSSSMIYGNAAYVYKKINSFANYRTPYWRTTDDGLLHEAGTPYLGYGPTFEGDLTDYNGTLGFRNETNGWNSDVSFTFGGNQQLYTVANSRNISLGSRSPIYFKPGGYSFSHNVGNIDVTKMLFENFNFGIGMELRKEVFKIMAGDTASVSGTGADSFPGIGEANASTNTRSNVGGYVDLAYDINQSFLLGATFRTEQYSDFGSTFVYKFSGRYKFLDDKVVLRASYSTGFRAPMLHQIYLQIAQQSFVPGQGIQSKGIFNNKSSQARQLGIPSLKPEKSKNLTVGLGLNPSKNLSITVDYYKIDVEDRIILGSEISESDTSTALYKILQANGVVAASFFTNGINTTTSGVDFVISSRNNLLGPGKLNINLAGNYVIDNSLDGAVLDPAILEGTGKTIFDATQEALLLSSRPEYKAILGFDYVLGRWSFSLNNTLFGPTTFRQAGLSSDLKTVFKPKILTDLGFNVELVKNLNFGFTVQNLLNVLPEYEFKALNQNGENLLKDAAAVKVQRNLITFNGRYPILTYDGSQFSQFGTIFAANLTLKF
jgi:iron complex outermembrane receptor protein